MLYGKMLDSINADDLNNLKTLIAVYFFVTMGTTLLALLEDWIGQIASFKISSNIKYELFTKIIHMKTSYVEKYSPGELMSRINGDADSVVSFYLDLITGIVQIVVNLGVSAYFVAMISLRLSTVAIFYIPATFALTIIMRKHYKKLTQKMRQTDDKYYGYMTEILPKISLVKVFSMEQSAFKKYNDLVGQRYKFLKKSIALNSANGIFSTLITLIASLYIIYLSGVLISADLLTIGAMVSFNTYINKLFGAVSNLWSINISKQKMMVSLERIIEITDTDTMEMLDVGIDVKKPANISAQNLTFGYDSTVNVLQNLSFKIAKNGFYSFVGENGCGKSTWAKLLVRLYDPDEGEICLNGHKLENCKLCDVRKNITYIPKEDFFLRDTVLNNILLGRDGIDIESVRTACKTVGIDEHIMKLEKRYYTQMGEGGTDFSSGQKQKINIARAVLYKSQIMIFDETTANLDGNAEKEVIAVLKELSKFHIILFISHKLSSIICSDEIFLIESGKIIDSGNFQHLITESNSFKKIFGTTELQQ